MSFYTNLVNGKYNTYEKVASANEDVVKDALNELSTEQLDALAEELDIFTKEASEINLESSLFEDDEYISYEIGKEAEETEIQEEVETEEGLSESETEIEEEELEVEASEEDEVVQEEEVEETETQEEVETEYEGHEDPLGEPGEAGIVNDEELEAEASEEDEFEIVKEACEQVGEYLVENNLTIADYVYSLTGLEKHATHIGEMAEKVAMVYDVPVVMAARDLVSTMVSLTDKE